MDAVKEKKVPFILLLFYFVMCGTFIIWILRDYERLPDLTREDGIMEYLCALFYGIAAAMFLYLCWHILPDKGHPGWGKLFYLGFFLLFFVVMMEEISWGQRIFGIATPENMREINYQDETTIHNIGGSFEDIYFTVLGVFLFVITIMFPVLKAFHGRFSRFISSNRIPVVDSMLVAGFASSFLFVYVQPPAWVAWSLIGGLCIPPVLVIIFGKNQAFGRFDLPLPATLLILVVGIALVHINTLPGKFNNVVFEMREFLFSVSFLLFSIMELQRFRSSKT